MKEIVTKYGYDAFVTPHASDQNPLLRAVIGLPKLDGSDPTLACLPHTFAAVIPDGMNANDLRKECVKECRAEWTRIAEAVRQQLTGLPNPTRKRG